VIKTFVIIVLNITGTILICVCSLNYNITWQDYSLMLKLPLKWSNQNTGKILMTPRYAIPASGIIYPAAGIGWLWPEYGSFWHLMEYIKYSWN